MRSTVRALLAAAVASAALLAPAGSSVGDPPNEGHCPDGFVLLPGGAILFPQKDTNNNGNLCVKEGALKDDNSAPPSEGDVVDDIVP